MTYSTYDQTDLRNLTNTVERVQSRLSVVSGEVDELQEKHQVLHGQVELHDDRLDGLDQATHEIREAHDELREKLVDDVAEVAATVKALTATIGWLERRVRAEQNITPLHIDHADDALRSLADRARQGRQSESVLLSAADRASHQRQIDALGQLQDRIRVSAEATLQHSVRLATTDRDSDDHRQAGPAFRQAHQVWKTAQAQLAATTAAAERARQVLQDDDERRAVHGPNVMTGESARTTLKTKLRERLAAAVADAALLPSWFTIVLGHQPPPTGTQQWLDTAVSLLMYRITYAVTDPVVALGPPPDDDDQRRTWHRVLTEALRKHRY
jgi:chromosome segregation ATPase